MSTCFVFDLDDTLIGSKQAVKAAYRHVGIDMPEDSWGKPWRDWLPDLCGGEATARIVHAEKNVVYPKMLLKHGVRLPLADTLTSMHHAGLHTLIITGASSTAAQAAVEFLELPHGVSEVELNASSKTDWLWYTAARFESGVYFDDQDNVQVPRGWMQVHVRQMEIA